jgi:integrase
MSRRRAPGEGSIFKRKDGRWVGVIPAGRDLRGRPRRVYVYGRTRHQAAARKKARELELGLTPQLEVEQVTVGHLLDRWLALRKNDVRPSTHRAYSDAMGKFATGLRPLALRRVGALDLDMHFQQLLQAGISAARVRFVRTVLSIAFGQAVRWRLLAYNPVRETTPPKVRAAASSFWSAEEAAAFLAHVRARCPWWPLFALAIATGMRRGELAGLRPQDLRLDRREIAVRRARVNVAGAGQAIVEPKTARGRRLLRISPDVISIMRWWARERDSWRKAAERIDLWHDSGYLFVWQDGRAVSPNAISATFRRLAKQAGLRLIRFHDLRHTHAVLELAAGLPLVALSERLGHQDAGFTLRVYADHVPRAKREPSTPTLKDLLEIPSGRPN